MPAAQYDDSDEDAEVTAEGLEEENDDAADGAEESVGREQAGRGCINHSRPKRFGKTKSANLQMFMAKASVRGNDTSNVVEGTHAADQPARSLVESATCSVIKRSLSPSLALSPL